jgi:hypothetical protein
MKSRTERAATQRIEESAWRTIGLREASDPKRMLDGAIVAASIMLVAQ